jgi:hypothetical protein
MTQGHDSIFEKFYFKQMELIVAVIILSKSKI